MQRYFIEVSYNGKNYSGFQRQENAVTIESVVTEAFKVYYREEFSLTGSSRTDAGVHALQNFFHVDTNKNLNRKDVYHLNAILPPDIVIKNIYEVGPDDHARFGAMSRLYRYFIYAEKDPFLDDRAFFYPYPLDMESLQQAADALKGYTDFTSFSKRNTQVKTFECSITHSHWIKEKGCLIYEVQANRFLRGMVRALAGTMLQVGRNKMNLEGFRSVIESKDCTMADFSTPAHALFLVKVNYDLEMKPIR